MAALTHVPPTARVPSADLIRMLHDARQRTLDLIQDLSGERLYGPQLSIVNPPLWEVGHVGYFHDHFALRQLHGLRSYRMPGAAAVYDSSAIPHDDRWTLPLPDLAKTLAYLSEVQDAMVARLPDGLAGESESYVYQLTTLHEDMHGEAFTYTRQALGYPPPELTGGAAPTDPGPAGPLPGDTRIPGGEHDLGSDESVPFRFDNEKQPHTVSVASFAIARAPVTNGEYAAFVEDGGYHQPALWSDAGWRWRQERKLAAPGHWRRSEDGGWQRRWFDRWLPLPPHHPVCHVSFHEAEAYCRWAGRRLPTEAEWEMAASRRPGDDGGLQRGKQRHPWGDRPPTAGRANLDGWRLDCVDVAALPEGDSAFGCRQMIGNVWEWTASVFGPFPGFRAELYEDYSQPWFLEGRRVLRGGAWATRSRLIHSGYRNFFTPDRNDILAGFRTCAL